MSENSDSDNVFNFEAFRKVVNELNKQKASQKEEREQEQRTPPDDFTKIFEAFGSLFKTPTPEEMDKAITGMAESLEKAAASIRKMQAAPEPKDDDDNKEEK